MAIGTAAARVTGLLRTLVFPAVLGVGGVRQGFDVANTLPNSLYALPLSVVLTSTLVPCWSGPGAVTTMRHTLSG
jgi:putative peptidoglycan lipid II flippase